MINKFRFWDAKHQRWFQGHPDEKHRNLQTDAIDLFGETFLMGEAYRDQNEDDIWKNDKDVHGFLDAINYIFAINPSQAFDINNHLIYEGDVIEFGNKPYIVFFHIPTLQWKILDPASEQTHNLYPINQKSSIIGNVYDNPEYLETVSEYALQEEKISIPPRVFKPQDLGYNK